MSRIVVRTNWTRPRVEQSWRASETACATSAALQPHDPTAAPATTVNTPKSVTLRPCMVPSRLKGTTTGGGGRYNRGAAPGSTLRSAGAAGGPSMPVALTDAEILDAERRARAALRTAPPTLSPGDGPDRFLLDAQREVIDFIREVGPPAVLRLVEEIRRLRAEQEKLIERLRNVETWNTEP